MQAQIKSRKNNQELDIGAKNVHPIDGQALHSHPMCGNQHT